MAKLTYVTKKGQKSIYQSFMLMTMLPLALCSIVMMIVCSYSVRRSIQSEVQRNLANVASSVLATYDILYDGDFAATVVGDEAFFFKGEQEITKDYSLIDSIKERTDMDISLFMYDTRLLTTLTDKNGERMDQNGANSKIVDEVLLAGNTQFIDNVRIGTTDYYAYYEPITSSGGERIGIIGVAQQSEVVESQVHASVWRNVAVMVVAMLLTAFCILRFSSSFVAVIKNILDFCKKLADGDLSVKLPDVIMQREDELGIIGRHMIRVQQGLRKLIERDALTGLYNRRSGEKHLNRFLSDGMKFAVSIGDIDFFKKFNDNFGHECGDVVLKEIAKLLNDSMTGKGYAVRWGGEEFLLLFENADDMDAYAAILEIIEKLHEKEVLYDGQIHKVTMSFGVAKYTGQPLNELVKAADDCLYEAKQTGRDRVVRILSQPSEEQPNA